MYRFEVEMKTLSVFNQKGGVGKTTATVNIGAAFALMLSSEAAPDQEPGRVLIVDLDQQIHASALLSGCFFGYHETSPGAYDDNPPSLGHLACNSLIAASHVLVPIQLAAPALFSLSETIRTIQSIQKKHNRELQLVGILATMCDFRYQEHKEFYSALSQQYGDLLLPPITRLAEVEYASSEGLDIFSFKPGRHAEVLASSSRATQEYAQVAEIVRQRMDR